MKPWHLALLVAVNLVWGYNYIAVKDAVDHMGPMWTTALRFAGVSLLLSPWLRWYPRRMGRLFGIAMMLGFMHFGFVFTGIKLAADIAVVAVVGQLSVPFGTIMGVLILKEKVGLWRAIGIAAAFLGVAVITFDPRVFGYVEAVLLIIGGAICGSLGFVLIRAARDVPALTMQGWIAAFSLPFMAALSLLVEGPQVEAMAAAPWSVWIAVAFIVVATSVGAHGSFNYLVTLYPLSLLLPLTLPTPLFGVLFGIWLKGNPATLSFLVGGALALAGVGIIVFQTARMGRQP